MSRSQVSSKGIYRISLLTDHEVDDDRIKHHGNNAQWQKVEYNFGEKVGRSSVEPVTAFMPVAWSMNEMIRSSILVQRSNTYLVIDAILAQMIINR